MSELGLLLASFNVRGAPKPRSACTYRYNWRLATPGQCTQVSTDHQLLNCCEESLMLDVLMTWVSLQYVHAREHGIMVCMNPELVVSYDGSARQARYSLLTNHTFLKAFPDLAIASSRDKSGDTKIQGPSSILSIRLLPESRKTAF